MCLNKTTKAESGLQSFFVLIFSPKALCAYFWTAKALCAYWPCAFKNEWTFTTLSHHKHYLKFALKCPFQERNLCLLFIDITKAFNRQGLWGFLRRTWCPVHFIGIIQSSHEGAAPSETARKSRTIFCYKSKQGYALTLDLFHAFCSKRLKFNLNLTEIYSTRAIFFLS